MKTEHYETIVIGSGVIGAAAAATLAQRGRRVGLLDQFAPPHTRGSSHGDGRIIRYAYPDALYVDLARHAYPLWQAWSERAGEPLYEITGGWDCVPVGSSVLADIERALTTYAIPYERLNSAESNRRFPQFHVDDDLAVIYQPDGGVAFADKTVRAFRRLAQRDGATLIDNLRVVSIEPDGVGVRVASATGDVISAETAIIAGGSWTGHLLAHLAPGLLPLAPLQVQVAHFPVQGNVGHTKNAMPYFIDYSTPLPHYGLPQIDVPGIKVGWHMHGVVLDDPDIETIVDDTTLPDLQAYVRRRLPHVSPEPSKIITCRYMMTPDEHFVLDTLPGLPQITVATGFSGHGFKFAPVIGAILADLASGLRPEIDISEFGIGRFTTT
ncbi:MAG: N-methyl-L-tryptophan oxidase [Anaerolineae bacterium]|nr:N-methyl-L-tryptophan oxidase [Anaerolineae bacterium]